MCKGPEAENFCHFYIEKKVWLEHDEMAKFQQTGAGLSGLGGFEFYYPDKDFPCFDKYSKKWHLATLGGEPSPLPLRLYSEPVATEV